MRLVPAGCFIIAMFLGAPGGYSQEKPAGSSTEEIRAIHQLLEQQTRQLDTLTQQVAKLSAIIETSHSISPAPAPSPAQNMPPVQETNPAPSPSPDASPPKAEPVDIGTTHVVTRGETLTSIAKQYKVGVGELQKVNKIRNDRMLQIGQTLTIPSPKTGDSHKKETQ